MGALMQVSATRVATGQDVFAAVVSLSDSAACKRRLRPNKGSRIMNKDRIKGTVKQVKGAVKEALGKASGDTSLEVEGKIEKAEGTLQKGFGEIKDALRKV